MSASLESLATCFQGLLPAQLYTCSRDGIPNAAFLSHVEYVDPSHVALSFQFFNKSRRNITENPQALIIVPDPDTGQGWSLRLRYVRSETEGPLFDRMALRIEAIASYCGLKGVFKLRAADVYTVLGIEALADETGSLCSNRPQAVAANPVFTVQALHDFGARIQRAESLETLVDSTLAGLEEIFGFAHSMILVPTEEPGGLVTIATRGYPESGVGAEARFGEGICGMVAEARKPIRISGLMRGMLYALAMHRGHSGSRIDELRRQIRLPGLASPESQLGVPLLARDDLVGVLCIESEVPYRFHEEDKVLIELLGSFLAIAMQNTQLREGVADPLPPQEVGAGAASRTDAAPSAPAAARDVAYYAADECVLVDGEYLIRSLPARILWRLLTAYTGTGRRQFTNRELRLDKSLNLPEWKDNLESRLVLLRRRLEQKCPDIRLVPSGRGRFALEIACELNLSTRP
jgi:hypothetical protein